MTKHERHRNFWSNTITTLIACIASNYIIVSCNEQTMPECSACKTLLNQADSLFYADNAEKALELQLEAFNLAQTPIEKARINTEIASTYYFIGEIDSTLNRVKQALDFFDTQTDMTYINEHINALDLYADALMTIDNTEASIEQYQKLSTMANLVGDEELYVNCQLIISNNELFHCNYTNAIEGYKSILKYCNTPESIDNRFNILRHLQEAYLIIGDLDEAYRLCNEMQVLVDDEYKKSFLCIAEYNYAVVINDTINQNNCIETMKQLSSLEEINIYDELDVISPIVYHYINKAQYDSAQYYFDKINYETKNPQSTIYIRALLFKAQLYLSENKIGEAIETLKIFSPETLKKDNAYYYSFYLEILADCYMQSAQYQQAYKYQKLRYELADSINIEQISHRLAYQDMIIRRDTTIIAQRIRIQDNQNTLDNLQILEYIWYIIIFVILDIAIIIFTQIKLKHNKEDEQEINEAKERLELEVARQTAMLQHQRDELKLRNSTLMSEIKYASRLQYNMLPKWDSLKCDKIAESFVLYQPCALISGDFYWFSSTDNKLFICCGDATGHGIPGTFIAMVSTTILNELTYLSEDTTALSLTQGLDNKLRSILQNNENIHINDTIDMSILSIDKKNNKICGVMARHIIYIVKSDGRLIKYQGVKRSIADTEQVFLSREFYEVEFDVESGDCIYLTTDGFESQFGEKENKKLNRINLEHYLTDIHTLPMNNQRTELRERLKKWQGKQEQTDDVLIIGLKIK